MTKSQQIPDAPQKAANQKNLMPGEPRDKPGPVERTAVEKAPEQNRQDQERLEELGEERVASKE